MKDHYEYKVGEDCWIFGIEREGGATKGEVVAIVDIPTHGKQYIIAINTGIDDLLEVRSGHILGMRPFDPRRNIIAEMIANGIAEKMAVQEIAMQILEEIGD